MWRSGTQQISKSANSRGTQEYSEFIDTTDDLPDPTEVYFETLCTVRADLRVRPSIDLSEQRSLAKGLEKV